MARRTRAASAHMRSRDKHSRPSMSTALEFRIALLEGGFISRRAGALLPGDARGRLPVRPHVEPTGDCADAIELP